MLSHSELEDLDNIFRKLKNPRQTIAGDEEKLYVCDTEPIYSPISVGEIRKLIAMAKKYRNLTNF